MNFAHLPRLSVLALLLGPVSYTAEQTDPDAFRSDAARLEPTLEAQFADFSAAQGIQETTVAGYLAARFTMRYTLQTREGRALPTQATIVMVPRGKVLYQFGFSAPPKGSDALTNEVDTVLASVKFVE